jgi:hypothetical protein
MSATACHRLIVPQGILHGALSFVSLSPMKYKGHSFRIGAATWAMQLGKSDAQIRSSGCWHSNAFLKYIRPDNSCPVGDLQKCFPQHLELNVCKT